MEEDWELYILNHLMEIDELVVLDNLVTLRCPERARSESSNHATTDPLPGRSDPHYRHAPAAPQYSAQVGSRASTRTGSAVPFISAPYHLSSSEVVSLTSGNFPLSGINVAVDPQPFQHTFGQGAVLTSSGAYIPSLLPVQSFAQPEFDTVSYPPWSNDIGLNDALNTGVTGHGISPVVLPSRLGSYDDGSLSKPGGGEMSAESENNFTRTAGLANYASASSPSGAASGLPQTKRELPNASRTSKNTRQRVSETVEERKSRISHNSVEKQYRDRLNEEFRMLLETLPKTIPSGEVRQYEKDRPSEGRGGGEGCGSVCADLGEKRASKGEVLIMARRYIKFLETERATLENERNELLIKLDKQHGHGARR